MEKKIRGTPRINELIGNGARMIFSTDKTNNNIKNEVCTPIISTKSEIEISSFSLIYRLSFPMSFVIIALNFHALISNLILLANM